MGTRLTARCTPPQPLFCRVPAPAVGAAGAGRVGGARRGHAAVAGQPGAARGCVEGGGARQHPPRRCVGAEVWCDRRGKACSARCSCVQHALWAAPPSSSHNTASTSPGSQPRRRLMHLPCPPPPPSPPCRALPGLPAALPGLPAAAPGGQPGGVRHAHLLPGGAAGGGPVGGRGGDAGG